MLTALNTADHFTLMMDHEIRKSGLSGNFCALVFELAGKLDPEIFVVKTERFLQRFPEANVRLKQQGRRYFWQPYTQGSSIFFTHQAKHKDAAQKIIQSIINIEVSAYDAAPITFHLINMPTGSFFLLRWFHPICDAKGAELITHYFLHDDETPPQGKNPFALLTNKWSFWKKLGMMYKAKKYIGQLDQTSSSLPKIENAPAEKLDFKLLSFDADTSKNIMRNAMKEAGMTGTSLYFIGCLMRALEKTGCQEKAGFCVPYAMNMRKRKALFPLFGNQVSFLFAQASMEQVRDRKKLFTSLREQHKTTIRTGLDQALVPLMWAGSWLPLEKYGGIIRNTPQGEERSSFWFSYTGEPEPQVSEIAGTKVKTMFQLSQVTSAPSLGMLVSQYNGEITLSFNYIAKQIQDEWLNTLTEQLAKELINTDKE
ncbi:MAG: hypothetical protein COB41_04525 [Proteobacteria bacterium]|nr:MAG: hypothetical protein COB41_04525 [Pseudomonadota bacterium]